MTHLGNPVVGGPASCTNRTDITERVTEVQQLLVTVEGGLQQALTRLGALEGAFQRAEAASSDKLGALATAMRAGPGLLVPDDTMALTPEPTPDGATAASARATRTSTAALPALRAPAARPDTDRGGAAAVGARPAPVGEN